MRSREKEKVLISPDRKFKTIEEAVSVQSEDWKNRFKVINMIFEVTSDTLDPTIQYIYDLIDKNKLIADYVYKILYICMEMRSHQKSLFLKIISAVYKKYLRKDIIYYLFNSSIKRKQVCMLIHEGIFSSFETRTEDLIPLEDCFDDYGKGTIGYYIMKDDVSGLDEYIRTHETIPANDIQQNKESENGNLNDSQAQTETTDELNQSIVINRSFDYNQLIETFEPYPLNQSLYAKDFTMMQLAAYYGSINVFKFLLTKGCVLEEGLCPYAIAGGNQEIISLLEEAGMQFSDCFKYAVEYHRTKLCDWLLEKYPKECYKMSLSACLDYCNEEAFAFFLENGASLDKRTAIHTACEEGNLELVKAVFAHGYTVLKTKPRETEVEQGKDDGSDNHRLIQYLVRHGTDYDDRSSMYNACTSGNIELVKFLIEQGDDINAEDEIKGLPIHGACWSGNLDLVKYIIEDLGVDPKKGAPLCGACSSENIEMVKYLIEKGADVKTPDMNDRKKQPIHIACGNGNAELVTLFLSLGADPNAMNEVLFLYLISYLILFIFIPNFLCNMLFFSYDYMTPILIACERAFNDIVKILVEHGADVNAQDEVSFS